MKINWKRVGGAAVVVVGLVIAIDGLTDIRQGLLSIMPAQILAAINAEADKQNVERNGRTVQAPDRVAAPSPMPTQPQEPAEIAPATPGPVRTAATPTPASAPTTSPDRLERTPVAPGVTPAAAPQRIVRTPAAPTNGGGKVELTSSPMEEEEVKTEEPAPAPAVRKTRTSRVAGFIKSMCR